MTNPPHVLCLGITGKVHLKATPDATESQRYTYAKARSKNDHFVDEAGQPMHLRRVTPSRQPPTALQLQQRRRLAAATAAWRALPGEEQGSYRHQAKAQHLTGFNLFVRVFYAAHPASEF